MVIKKFKTYFILIRDDKKIEISLGVREKIPKYKFRNFVLIVLYVPINFTLRNFFKVVHELFAHCSETDDAYGWSILVQKLSRRFDSRSKNCVEIVQNDTAVKAQPRELLLPRRMGVPPNYGTQKLVLNLHEFEVITGFAVHHEFALIGCAFHRFFQEKHRRAQPFPSRQKCAVKSRRCNRRAFSIQTRIDSFLNLLSFNF